MRIIVRLMSFTKKYWRSLVFSFVCLMGTTYTSLIVPRMLGQGVDEALGAGEVGTLIRYGAIIIGAAALRGLFQYGNRFITQVVSQKISYDLRNAIYERLQKLSFAYHDKAQTGQLMSRATADIEAVRMFTGEGLLTVAQTIIQIVATSWILLTLNWKLALLTLVFMPVIGWRAVYVSNILRPMWLVVQQMMGAMSTTVQESLMGIKVVKGFARQPVESLKFSTDARKNYDEHIKISRIQAFNQPLMTFLLALPVVVILWFGGTQVIAKSMTVGGVTQFLLYIGMLAMPVRRLGMIANTVSRTVSSGERIYEILDAESPVKEKPGAAELGKVKGQVIFENVSFSYDSKAPALKNVSFAVQPGQLVALLGGSGSGKSTLINLISRFYDVTGGRITVDGTDIRDVTLASLRKNVGIAQQDIFLFSTSIKDNIAYGSPKATMEEIITAARAAQIHDFIQSLPQGYDSWVGERGHTLSGGEKQRVAIARTLLVNPSILILDDSMSSVDASTEHLIRLALEELIKNRTTFIITHRIPIIKHADLILMMKDGEIVERGTHEELIAEDGLYRQTYLSQLAATEDSAVSGRGA